jgi:hypothetical protein
MGMTDRDTDFLPLPDGCSLEPQPFTEDQITDLAVLFGTAREADR